MSIRNSTKILTFSALMVVIMILCSWISVPLAVPFTLQTFGVFLSLRLLGGKRGTLSIAVYILMGAIGLPVFSGFSGGIGHLLGPTGGYIIGFLVSGLCYIFLERVPFSGHKAQLLKMTVSLAVCYLFGTLWFSRVYGASHGMSIGAVLMACVVPFIVPDLLKIAAAEFFASRLKILIPKDFFLSPARAKADKSDDDAQ